MTVLDPIVPGSLFLSSAMCRDAAPTLWNGKLVNCVPVHRLNCGCSYTNRSPVYKSHELSPSWPRALYLVVLGACRGSADLSFIVT